jgi:hypothetical protein
MNPAYIQNVRQHFAYALYIEKAFAVCQYMLGIWQNMTIDGRIWPLNYIYAA